MRFVEKLSGYTFSIRFGQIHQYSASSPSRRAERAAFRRLIGAIWSECPRKVSVRYAP